MKQLTRRPIEGRLMEHPERGSEPLRRTLKPYRKLRAGDYRVVMRIENQVITILAGRRRANQRPSIE